MLRFQYEEFFWLLVLVPILVLLYLQYSGIRRKKFSKYFSTTNLQALLTVSPKSILQQTPWLLVLAVVLLVFGMANLQSGQYGMGTQKVKGKDLMYVLDVSKSMNASDVSPSRLELSKLLISKLINKSSNDRLGLIVFAGDAEVLSPLSSDHLTLRQELQHVRPGMSRIQGTNLSAALRMAQRSFEKNNNKSKAIVLITDGEDHEQNLKNEAQLLKTMGVNVYSIGVGSKQGSTFIDVDTGKEQVDKNGKVVVSKMNPEVIKEVAQNSGGEYTILRSVRQASSDILSDLSSLGSNVYSEANFSQSRSFYLIFVILGFICILIQTISVRIVPKATFVLLLSLTFYTSHISAQATNADQEIARKLYQANKQVYKKNYQEADKLYEEVLDEQSDNVLAQYNLATSKYFQKAAPEARAAYENALTKTGNNIERSQILYNIGNTYMLEKNWDAAIDNYKEALKINPNDENARYNLAYAQKMKKQEDQNKKKQQKKDNNDQDKKDQDKKDENKKDQKKKDNQEKKNDQDKKSEKDKSQKPKQEKGKQQNQKQKSNQGQKPKPKMSKEQADRALKMLRKKSGDFKNGDTIRAYGRPQNEKDW